MDIIAQAMKNAAMAQQAASTPSGCKACQRTGVPVLPLRVAAVPDSMVRTDWHPSVPAQNVPLSGKAFKYALRTLRMGYLYVLLDKSVWQAYEVTAAGCMRQFNPYEMPEGDRVDPLSEACRTAGHDVITSFINLDDRCYSEAWLAFSTDPWTKAVLDGYKNGLRPDSRFTRISIATLKNSPHSIPEAMALAPDLASLKANVAEFATGFFPDTSRIGNAVEGSVHGFYPRTASDKQRQTGMHIVSMGEQYRCQISALVLNDSVGVVQELNNARMQIAETTQAYLEEPGVFHKHMISLAITSYMDSLKADIEKSAQPEFDLKPSEYVLAGPSFGTSPSMIAKEDVAKNSFAALQARLMTSYDEPARAASEQEFEQRFEQPQRLLTAVDNDLAGWYQSEDWLTVIQHDYSPDTRVHSWVVQNGTLAVCLQGGAMGVATDRVWLDWLGAGSSPAYAGFTGMDSSQLDNVFNFGNYKTGLTSDEFSDALKSKRVQQGLGARMLAVSGSAGRLVKTLSPSVRKSSAWMIQAAMQSAGEPALMMNYTGTLRQLQQRFSSGGDSAAKGGTTAAAAGAVVALNAQTMDIPVKMTVAVPGTLTTLQQQVPAGMAAASAPRYEMSISELSLAGRENAGVVIRATEAELATFNERGRRVVSGDGVGLIMGAGLLAIQMYGWHELQERLRRETGNEVDVTADVTISTLLMMEGFTEMLGFATKLAIKENWLVLSKAAQVPFGVRLGGVLGGIAGIVEGIRDGVHSHEALNDGDKDAANNYRKAEFVSIIGGFGGVLSGGLGAFSLTSTVYGFLIPGPAIVVGVLLLLGAIWSTKAKALRSTSFEIWLRRTCFGIPNGAINALPVWHAESQKDLTAALADYRAIRSGMVADVAFGGTTLIQSEPYSRVEFRVALPGWDAARGGWSVRVTSDSDNRVLFSQSQNAPGIADHQQSVRASESYSGVHQVSPDGTALTIQGNVWVAQSRTPGVTMVADYWIDRTDPGTRMGLTVSAAPSWINSDTTEQWSVK